MGHDDGLPALAVCACPRDSLGCRRVDLTVPHGEREKPDDAGDSLRGRVGVEDLLTVAACLVVRTAAMLRSSSSKSTSVSRAS